MLKRIRKTKGFTLIELIIVFAIIAILAVVGFSSWQGYSNQRTAQETSIVR